MISKRGIIIFFILFTNHVMVHAQSYNQDKIALTNFIKRMYNQEPFTGVKIFQDYDNRYLVSVISLFRSNYSSDNAMTRVAEVKSKSQVSQFLNGSHISSETIIVTIEDNSVTKKTTYSEVIEKIRETSIGYTESLELVTTFDSEIESGKRVYIYIRTLEKLNPKKR